MTLITGIYILDLFLAVVLDGRFQIAFGVAWLIQWATRIPRPRKGASRKPIFITSCDSAIGQRIARRFDDMNACVFAGFLNPESPAAKGLKKSCSSRLQIVPFDISNEKMVEEAVLYVKENMPAGQQSLYGLVNNAGVVSYSNFDLMTIDHCKKIIDINLLGTIRVTKKFLPLIKIVSGRIVNVSSILGRLTCPNTSIYSATKHGLDGFFSTLRFDLNSVGVHVATVEPGNFSTTDAIEWTRSRLGDMWESLTTEEQNDKLHLYDDAKRKYCKTQELSKNQEQKFQYIIENVEDAMFAEEPYHRYVSASSSQRFILAMFRILPDDWYQSIMSKSSKMS